MPLQFLPVDITPSAPPESGVYIGGLKLHNAFWDASKSSLTQPTNGSKPCKMPYIWLKPIDKVELEKIRAGAKYELYDCPVYMSSGSGYLDWRSIVASVEMPSLMSPGIWAERRVHLSCAWTK